MGTPEVEFKGTETDKVCPNCGSPLYSGLAGGTILVCAGPEGEGCGMAVDPAFPVAQSVLDTSGGAWDAEASPEIGPPNEVPAEAPELHPEMQTALEEPYQGPGVLATEPSTPPPPAPAPSYGSQSEPTVGAGPVEQPVE